MKSIKYSDSIPKLNKIKQVLLDLNYKNLELWPSMAPSAYFFIHNKTMGTTLFQILRIFKFVFFKEKFNVIGDKKNKILVSFLIDRKDHHNLWKSCLSKFNKTDLIILDSFQNGRRDILSILNRFSISFPNFFKIYGIHQHFKKHRLIVGSRLDHIYFITQIYFQFKKIDYLSGIVDEYVPRSYVAYSSYRNNDETILTQLVNAINKSTFTFQNYIIPKFKRFDYETITYENMISDYFLLWGKSSYDTLKKHLEKNKLIICGNPLYEGIIKKPIKRFDPKVCTIFLSHPNFKKSNLNIIDIMDKFSREYPHIKFQFNAHPDNNESELAKLLDGKNLFYIFNNSCTKEELLRKSDFIIMYNSTILIEALAYALPIFRYNGDDMKDMLVFSNNFVNFVELKDSFESLFDPITYSKVLRLHKKDYKNCFFQPSNDSVSEIYKKIIKNKTKGSHI
ncbi:glycosyltransferase [archaeon]|jgi:hypothetical protein|nr:glycosyltransferase [archaeon]MBT6824230.1 glycosyltransferase [archaeon]MBT7106768.1 glycosyltransferase [archaeon]MBT7297538.1 glycosyltransferase [archaeon]